MNGAENLTCDDVRDMLARLGTSLEPAPQLQRHLQQCAVCWEHWADHVDATVPASPEPMAWDRVVGSWTPGPDASALWTLMRELPPYRQPAGARENVLEVEGIKLRVGPLKVGKKEKRWQAVAIDVAADGNSVHDKWLVGIYPKESVETPQHMAFCAQFTPLKRGGYRATVVLSMQSVETQTVSNPPPSSELPAAELPMPTPSAKLLLEGLYLLRLVDLPLAGTRKNDSAK